MRRSLLDQPHHPSSPQYASPLLPHLGHRHSLWMASLTTSHPPCAGPRVAQSHRATLGAVGPPSDSPEHRRVVTGAPLSVSQPPAPSHLYFLHAVCPSGIPHHAGPPKLFPPSSLPVAASVPPQSTGEIHPSVVVPFWYSASHIFLPGA
jgi:hypothetical protein